ncbi:TIGR04283 family arsenosugar biosynthesis glycosyltransferase [Litoribrevibacter albus]|uniref:Glycosyl transferase n=1 Tax=Litoribrevibacter albus TaxID=1473156 RepID=A0AA37W892_9GAMM|nr:TIGR04283 family arsenosugar biosynthesis glycosyltransferase [Litoribrevibacter albus]GLQ32203.1 glycosyl transferase [Litoribrevibacter albus]
MAAQQGRAAVVVVPWMVNDLPAKISVIIPVYRDAEPLALLLEDLTSLDEFIADIVVVDGGQDVDLDTASELDGLAVLNDLVSKYAKARLVRCAPQRAGQMNYGVRFVKGEVLWFLHADTRIEEDLSEDLHGYLKQSQCRWGRFNVRLDQDMKTLRMVAFMMNWRSRLTSICTGDQGMLVDADVFLQVEGFPNQALMEDIELSKKLKRVSTAFIPNKPIVTSSRKWLTHGVFKTIRTMWYLRLIYWLGASPQKIHQLYYGRKG